MFKGFSEKLPEDAKERGGGGWPERGGPAGEGEQPEGLWAVGAGKLAATNRKPCSPELGTQCDTWWHFRLFLALSLFPVLQGLLGAVGWQLTVPSEDGLTFPKHLPVGLRMWGRAKEGRN